MQGFLDRFLTNSLSVVAVAVRSDGREQNIIN